MGAGLAVDTRVRRDALLDPRFDLEGAMGAINVPLGAGMLRLHGCIARLPRAKRRVIRDDSRRNEQRSLSDDDIDRGRANADVSSTFLPRQVSG